ncbi:MAG: hypothetical protein C4586_01060 [Anaerolineaceae bacterium]|nr:MAG: hypothetical protein C4586_01060 [Anaerolineaceae bacterium]
MTNAHGTDSSRAVIAWNRLEDLSARLSKSGVEPGTVPDSEWHIITQTLSLLVNEKDWSGILRLRAMFTPLYARDTVTGLDTLQLLDQHALQAARHVGDKHELGHILGSKGHNLHRQGYHREAIEAFEEAAHHYREAGNDSQALKSYYMTSLCYRALGKRDQAKQILETVLRQTDPADPWRANPMQVMAWLIQDEGKLEKSEKLLLQALHLYRQTDDSDLLVVGALADLGEIADILGHTREARGFFEESLSILARYQGQYDRQEARTLLKYCEYLIHQKDYVTAMKLLNRADDKVGRYGHYYDLLWQIELAKALIYFLEGRFFYALTKIRSVFRIRRHLGLPNTWLIKHVLRRFAQRLWALSFITV